MIALSAAIAVGITSLGALVVALTVGRRRPAYCGRHRALW